VGIIATRSLTKVYPGVRALDDLTLDVEPGVIGLVGANGAGKTTMIKTLLGLLAPTSGEVRVLGLDPVTQGGAVRAVVGYMPEHDCLPPDMIAAEFVTHMARMSGLPKTVARERASEALRHVGLYEERYRQIGGYSTGMRQRVKLAQALVHDPDLLLLDEPTNGLDPAGMAEMRTLIRRLGASGRTVLLSSHLLGEVEQICDRVGVISRGRIVAESTVAELRGESTLWVGAEPLDRAAELARSLLGRDRVRVGDGGLELAVPPDRAAWINGELVDGGIAVSELRRHERDLEAVFLELTGGVRDVG
jgi:ABC-2 type transport system ATP-binding protein